MTSSEDREWLVTNGLGGYASGTVSGAPTRRYHGFLIAALPSPLGRIVMLNDLGQRVEVPDDEDLDLRDGRYLKEFVLDGGLPVWRFDASGAVIERRVRMLHRQNTVHVTYRLLDGVGLRRLHLTPAVDFRPHEAPVNRPIAGPYAMTIIGDRYEIRATTEHMPPLRVLFYGERAHFTVDGRVVSEIPYPVEQSRGYAAMGDLWTPGHFTVELVPGGEATLVVSTESWETIEALDPNQARSAELERRARLLAAAHPAARTDVGSDLVLAADQFIVTPVGRFEHAARAQAAGDEVRTIVAGYHWFTDWGRDTMISLEGLTLVTGRRVEAGYIIRTFASYVRDGLIPNMFPEGQSQGLYHTADATLWFFHAIDRYLDATNDFATLRRLLPTLVNIVERHLAGTRFGIRVDPDDGLLRQGEIGYQLTWMDAKVGDWVVTPRMGKAVEINALWYNALRLLEGWLELEQDDRAKSIGQHADRTKKSFNERFWFDKGGYLYDIVDGDRGSDEALRPNQLFAISLPHAVLEPSRWKSVVDIAREQLLTPVGLRTLAPDHPDYKSRYYGDLRSRDAAYHQGTVWAWLIGPFVDAWLRVYPNDKQQARKWLEGFPQHLIDAGVGSLSEIFDAEPPFTPRGCIAQAWSIAEVLRAWVKTAGD